MRHAIPDGDIATIFDRAITLLLDDLAHKKHAATARPRTDSRPARTDTRHLPAEVKRLVWERDGAWVYYGAVKDLAVPATVPERPPTPRVMTHPALTPLSAGP